MNSEDLILMNDDQIDYNGLPEKVLQTLALSDELFIATSALVELRLRKSPLATSIALEILSQSHGDRYLQASALSTLFAAAQDQAINFILQHVEDFEPYLLNALMEIMIDNSTCFQSEPALFVVQIVGRKIQGLDQEKKYPEVEVENRFLNIYDIESNR
jgi:hypothetical protein